MVIYLFVDLTFEIVWCCLHHEDELERDVEGNGFGPNYSNIPALAEGSMESYRIASSRIVGVRALTDCKSQKCYC